ncbi:ABC transporter permease [Verrucomicrobium spinosum]|uniref:ABC transporter permease n=1 Tax=Verrucomicrobium spinosum TaxID=2736 RepID=UPI000A75E748|nr:ABC transporter permease [Verrucomicrobium spinosum]
MFAFILRRFLSSLVVLGFVVSLTFLLSISQKGGPFEREKLTAAAKAEREKNAELDGPKWWQLARYVKRLLKGDLNVSLRYQNLSVAEVLGQKLPNSLILGGSAFVIAAVGGVSMGFLAAMRKDSALDVTSMFLALRPSAFRPSSPGRSLWLCSA